MRANLSQNARTYLASLGIVNPDTNSETAGLIWMHSLAIGYSPAYIEENADGIKRDWPRIPLPADLELLRASAALGRHLVDLLDGEREVAGVTAGNLEPLFQAIGVVTGTGGALDADAGDLAVTAGWAHVGAGGVTMPAKGKVVARKYSQQEADAIAAAARQRGLPPQQVIDLLGRDTRDVYLNGKAYWKNVPANVWAYFIGGYQVIKKWLNYREQEILGRPLRIDEARYATDMARRITAILLMQPPLDENYMQTKEAAFAWPAGGRGDETR